MSAEKLARALGRGVRILAWDGAVGLTALDKPSGVRSHPNRGGSDGGALLCWPYDTDRERYVEPGGEGAWFELLHRLDSATSGVCVLAFTEAAAMAGKRLFAQREVQKVYRAVVAGAPAQRNELWKDRLMVTRGEGRVRVRTHPRGVLAETAVRVVRRTESPWGPIADLELRPHTGRTHQLRVQAARRHLPILGDQTYGDFRLNRALAQGTGVKRLLLHASAIAFDTPNLCFSAEAPVPSEFTRVLGP